MFMSGKVLEGKALPLRAVKKYTEWGGDIFPLIINLGTIWIWVCMYAIYDMLPYFYHYDTHYKQLGH
jgi:hypothetical protein